jgi:hypothetical protein
MAMTTNTERKDFDAQEGVTVQSSVSNFSAADAAGGSDASPITHNARDGKETEIHHEGTVRAQPAVSSVSPSRNISGNPVKNPKGYTVKTPQTSGAHLTSTAKSVGIKSKKKPPYLTWKLKVPWISTLIILQVVIIVAISVLNVVSSNTDGIASVPQLSDFSLTTESTWVYGLLWTALPTFLMKLLESLWNTSVSATASRQPYVNLVQPKEGKEAHNAKNTILLDYTSPLFYTWVQAFHRGHNMVGTALLMSLIVSLALIPLTSHLLYSAPSTISQPITIVRTGVLNETALTGATTIRPAIDLAKAILGYDSALPSWTTREYAFIPFNLSGPGSVEASANITTHNATAYSALLDCQQMPITSQTASLSVPEVGVSILSLNGTDRGCAVSAAVPVSNSTALYAQSWNTPHCADSTSGRLGLITGSFDDSSPIKLRNPTWVSCIPSYNQTQGVLTVSSLSSAVLVLSAFTITTSQQTSIEATLTLEHTLHSYFTFDPSSGTQVDAFGDAVLAYAQAQSPDALNDPYLVGNATQTVYATIFAGVARTVLIQPLADSTQSDATATIPVTRLYVAAPIAWTLVAIVACVLVCTVGMFAYGQVYPSILREKPVGLLGRAVILDRSEVSEFVRDMKDAAGEDEDQIEKYIQGWYSMKGTRCWFDEREGRIKLVRSGKREMRKLGKRERLWRAMRQRQPPQKST